MKLLFIILTALQILLFVQSNAQNDRQNDPSDLYREVEDESELDPGENIDEKIRKNFFLLAEVSKKECFVGEPIMASFKAYSRLDANSQVVKRPSLSGFSVVEMVDAYNNQPAIEKYNGEYYYVHLIRKVQLFPLQPGTFTLESAEVESIIQFRRSEERRKNLRLRELFRRGHHDPDLQRQLTFRTPEVDILVHALPDKDQPEDYSGAVGSYSIEMSMEDTSAILHEPAIVKLMIRGTGNFPLITDPPILWPAGVVVSGPVVNEEVNKYVYPLSGVKQFQFTLDNSGTGNFAIPAVRFTYFDPGSKFYKTIETKPVHYTVAQGTNSRKNPEDEIITVRKETPLHLYYFGVIALIIIGLVIYLAIQPSRRKPS